MSFSKRQHMILKKESASSLQTHQKNISQKLHCRKSHAGSLFLFVSPRFPKRILNSSVKNGHRRNATPFTRRMSSFIYFWKNHLCSRGSLTIEAALTLPMFLFAMISLLSFIDILRVQIKLDSSMQQVAKELAVYGHAGDDLIGRTIGDVDFFGESIFSEFYVKSRVIELAGKELLEKTPLETTSQITFLGSRILEEDRIELYSTYEVTPYFSILPSGGFYTGTACVAHVFNGYDNSNNREMNQTEEYVFVTETGTAYHKDRGCTYLDLSIHSLSTSDISTSQNVEGGYYYPCEICGGTANSVVYVTDYGTRYHKNLLCSSLKRTIYTIPISEVGGRHACSKCG